MGNCAGMYSRSVADLAALCLKYGVELKMYYLFNESLITRARNYCCINKSAVIETEDGPMLMGDIVDSKYDGKVLSYDADGNASYQSVINWMKRSNTQNKLWVQVQTNNGARSKKKLICTEDHRLAVFSDIMNPNIEYKEAWQSEGYYSVRKVNSKVGNRTKENALLNSDQLSVLIGTIAGDSHINKTGAVVYGHGPKQHEYSEYKSHILNATVQDSFGKSGFVDDDNYHVKHGTVPINEQTKFLRDLVYSSGKKDITTLLPYMNWKSLAFWYMDDGYRHKYENKSDRAILCTQGQSKEQNEKIVEYLNKNFGIQSFVSHNSVTDKYFITMNPEGTKIFYENIAPYVHEELAYKISNEYQDLIATKELNDKPLDFSASKITSITYLEKTDSRGGALYDITVSNNHNFVANGSLVHNCDEFMRSDSTHLVFIDSDIGFNPQDVIAMLALQTDESPYDVIAGPYPKKAISWEKIKQAVDKGVADENPNELENYVGDYVFNPVAGKGSIPIGEPVEVSEAGTGFMMIRRSTFELFDAHYPQQSYKPDHVRTEHFDGTREIMAYFDCIIDRGYTFSDAHKLMSDLVEAGSNDPDKIKELQKKADHYLSNETHASKRYLSEDYNFCYLVRRAGGQVWFCPWMRLHHVGSYVFGGSLAHMAQIGAAATADVSKLGKSSQTKTVSPQKEKPKPKSVKKVKNKSPA